MNNQNWERISAEQREIYADVYVEICGLAGITPHMDIIYGIQGAYEPK